MHCVAIKLTVLQSPTARVCSSLLGGGPEGEVGPKGVETDGQLG